MEETRSFFEEIFAEAYYSLCVEQAEEEYQPEFTSIQATKLG